MRLRRRTSIPAAIFLGTILLGVGCDYSTKAWAESALEGEPNQTVSAIDPYVDLSLQHNEGTAFSFVRDLGSARAVLGGFALLLAVGLFVMAIRAPEDRWRSLAFGVVAAGAIGNGLDRVLRDAVTDFVVVHYPWGGSWPAFNVADVLVVVGVALLILRDLRPRPRAAASS